MITPFRVLLAATVFSTSGGTRTTPKPLCIEHVRVFDGTRIFEDTNVFVDSIRMGVIRTRPEMAYDMSYRSRCAAARTDCTKEL